MDWRDFWNTDTPIYVSERHKDLHYRLIARDIIALIPANDAHVLDYGCGEALSADRVAARCAKLYLCDAAPTVRTRIGERFRDVHNIQVLAPEGMEQLPDHQLDLIVVNSVVQYLSLDELRALLAKARAKLKSEGRLVIADVVPADLSPIADAAALLSFAGKGGFLGAAVIGLARTALSDYRKLRNEVGLAQYDEPDMLDILTDSGFSAERRAQNLGHNQARMTFVARPA
jgi:ubiquinone/menaquinone biosynthesis C-methylase UbiE